MAIISNFVGSNWIPNTTQTLQWKYFSIGSWSNAGNTQIISLSEFATQFTLNVSIDWGPININFQAQVTITLTDENPTATSGPVNLVINGTQETTTYSVSDSGISINNISYNGHTVSLVISASGANTEIYVNSGSDSTSFYLQVI